MVNIDKLFGLFIFALIAVALYTPMTDYIEAANVTGTPGTLLALVPVLWIILIVAAFAFALKKEVKG